MKEKIYFNAYTDASSFNNGKKIPMKPQISSSVGLLTFEGLIVDYIHEVNPDTTISFGELNAICKTLELSTKIIKDIASKTDALQPPYNINLYSDSAYCVNSLMKWIKQWKKKAVKGIWYTSSGPVAYQEIMKYIDEKFIQDDMFNIKIYHVRGHINAESDKQLNKAKKTFEKVNGKTITINELKNHLYFNDVCDRYAVSIMDKYRRREGIE